MEFGSPPPSSKRRKRWRTRTTSSRRGTARVDCPASNTQSISRIQKKRKRRNPPPLLHSDDEADDKDSFDEDSESSEDEGSSDISAETDTFNPEGFWTVEDCPHPVELELVQKFCQDCQENFNRITDFLVDIVDCALSRAERETFDSKEDCGEVNQRANNPSRWALRIMERIPNVEVNRRIDERIFHFLSNTYDLDDLYKAFATLATHLAAEATDRLSKKMWFTYVSLLVTGATVNPQRVHLDCKTFAIAHLYGNSETRAGTRLYVSKGGFPDYAKFVDLFANGQHAISMSGNTQWHAGLGGKGNWQLFGVSEEHGKVQYPNAGEDGLPPQDVDDHLNPLDPWLINNSDLASAFALTDYCAQSKVCDCGMRFQHSSQLDQHLKCHIKGCYSPRFANHNELNAHNQTEEHKARVKAARKASKNKRRRC